MSFVQAMMALAGVAYLGSTIGWLVEGKYWMAATFFLYALTIVTLYMAGKS